MFVTEMYNQEEEIDKLMQQLEQERLVFNPNSFREEDIDEKMHDLKKKGYSEQQIQKLLSSLESTTLEQSVQKILLENEQITLDEIAERFAPLVRQRVRKIAKQLLAKARE